MKGLDIARAYFEEYGKAMLEAPDFAGVKPFAAAGLLGSGSECLGFDDDASADHDMEPGFIVFLPGEDVVSRRDAFLLERAYAKLPKEFMGLKRQALSPVGGSRHGIIRTCDFMMEKTGTPDGRLSDTQWLTVPEQNLLEVVNGEVFADHYGELTGIRETLSYYPERIWKKKLAGRLLQMGQAGQYNYRRCLLHGEQGAAQMAVFEFVKSAMAAVFILNKAYMPYYKWGFRALRDLPVLPLFAELMEYLITTDNDGDMPEDKSDVMESMAADIIDVLKDRGLSEAICGDLEKHAYSVNDGIEENEIRNMHILAAV